MYHLLKTMGRSQHETLILSAGELLLIGRGDHCDFQLKDPSASRVHCRLLARDGKVFLTDAGSRWGTFVNGVRVSECELLPGDEILIGETALRLVADGEARGTTLARHSEFDRPPGLTIDPRAQFQTPPIVARATNAGTAPKWDGPAFGDKGPGVVSPLNPIEFVGSRFAFTSIEKLVGRTRTGLLFRGLCRGQAVAIKLLHPHPFQEETAKTRFLRAVEATRGLKHPNLVELIDGGILDGIPYAISEFIEGESAAEMIHRVGIAGMLDWRITLRIALDVASALAYLESQGVMHRNVTPQHLLVNRNDRSAKLSDLLLAKALDESQPVLTQPGEVLGEIAYVSPEQLGSGQPVDHRSDFYQLGATLYALLTGRPPFEGANVADIMARVLHEAPPPPTRYHLSIPPLLEGTIITMLEKRPQNRFATASALLTALERVHKYAR